MRKGLFLKVLFVSASDRGRGTGRALMSFCAAAAVEGGYSRIDFSATAADAQLSVSYRDPGAVLDSKRNFLRIAGEDPTRLAEKNFA